MKAKYILAALEAMKAAEKHLQQYPDDPDAAYRASWAISDALTDARINLKVYSGLSEPEVAVEKDAA